MDRSKYYASAIAAFSIWGFFSLALRPLHQYEAMDILFYRVFLCVVLLLLIAVLFRRAALNENLALFRTLDGRSRKKFVFRNIASGVLLTANWFFFIYVMNHVSVRATSLAYLVCPILTAVLASFFLKEYLKKLQWAAIAIAAGGCIALSFGHFVDLLLSIVVAISYAIYLVLQKKNAGFDMLLMLVFHIVVSAVLLLPFYPAYGGMPQEPVFYAYIALIAVGFTIIPLFLNLYALKGINSATVGMLLNINPMIAFALAIWKYDEKADWLQFTGYAVIFVSVLLFNAPALLKKRDTV